MLISFYFLSLIKQIKMLFFSRKQPEVETTTEVETTFDISSLEIDILDEGYQSSFDFEEEYGLLNEYLETQTQTQTQTQIQTRPKRQRDRSVSASSSALLYNQSVQSPLNSMKNDDSDYDEEPVNALPRRPTLRKSHYPMDDDEDGNPFSDENKVIITEEGYYQFLHWRRPIVPDLVSYAGGDDDDEVVFPSNYRRSGLRSKLFSKSVFRFLRKWRDTAGGIAHGNYEDASTATIPTAIARIEDDGGSSNKDSSESPVRSANMYETDVSSISGAANAEAGEDMMSLISNDCACFRVKMARKFKRLCTDKSERSWEKTGDIPKL